MRLIDADALEKAINGWMPKDQETWMNSDIPPIENLVVSIMMTIQEQPTVDAVPVRHGKWFIGTVPYFVCSECKNRTPLRWDERCGYVLDYRSPYCPNCGARMEERKEE